MDQLMSMFSRLLSPEIISEAQANLDRDASSQSKSIRVIPHDPISEAKISSSLASINATDQDHLRSSFLNMLHNIKPRHPPLERLPCANAQVEKHNVCPNPGTRACTACNLVSYCSKDCQNAHWRIHKIDCKNKLKSDEWKPSYITEQRPPSFISDETPAEEFAAKQRNQFSAGISLWGNIPAMDIIRLSNNEQDPTKDFSLAFVASGDLRHLMRTINALPSNYSGNLTIMINDISVPTVCRNILLLLILGTISDTAMAAEIALHFWYSVFMPQEYRLQMTATLSSFLQRTVEDGPVPTTPLGPRSTLSVCIPPEANDHFMHFISQSVSLDEVQHEYDRVRTAPSREDFRERMYARLRPSHRVAFEEYRRFGIVLPFGAVNAHFNTPNVSLFSLDGTWLQTDYADPLEGWDLEAVIAGGKAHGAKPEDIYGCLYFYLSDQLRLLVERIQKFNISFIVLGFEASMLSDVVLDNKLAPYSLPASIRFDRIEVSNIMDNNYVGIDGVLTAWGPLLAEKNPCATILGYFMNWVALGQPDGHVSDAGSDVYRKLIVRLFKEGKCSSPRKAQNKNSSTSAMDDMLNFSLQASQDIQAFYDNSQPFLKFLRKQRLNAILLKTNLFRKEVHTIVPHRISAPLSGPASESALPEFPDDDDSWYYGTKLHSYTWAERFVEFGRR